MNKYPHWKYFLIIVILAVCTLYALPNLFGEDPAVQISPTYASEGKITPEMQKTIEGKLQVANIKYDRIDSSPEQLLIRFTDTDTQLDAYSLLKDILHQEMPGYVAAQNLASATPDWLTSLGAKPMYLGLDLRGGVHFLMQVDMETAIRQDQEQYLDEFRTLFRENKLRYKGLTRVTQDKGGISVTFTEKQVRDQAHKIIVANYDDLDATDKDGIDEFSVFFTFTEVSLKNRQNQALEQNITTLRNRVNELGVAEPVIQRQGDDRIVVQLPGVQDTARAKEILGATATLEFRLVEGDRDQWYLAEKEGKVPVNARLYKQRNGPSILLNRRVIATGDQIVDASAGIDQQTGSPAAMVRLDGKGAKRMFDTTDKNVGEPMAVVFIEYNLETKVVDGKIVKERKKVEEVVNVATIREAFGKRFQITGLTFNEASNLALILRAGALKAPMEIIEERTVGPSLGKENIRQGIISIVVGFLSVLLFMLWRYRAFGMVANLSLLLNVVVLISLLSLLQATLTLPGIAGIVLTLGMAVDANVLIFERIREELHNKNSPQASIHSGFEKAFGTIADSNITTLIAGVMLFGFGTGAIKGFAITLSLGILTSMFTAIFVGRAMINLLYGGKKLQKLSI